MKNKLNISQLNGCVHDPQTPLYTIIVRYFKKVSQLYLFIYLFQHTLNVFWMLVQYNFYINIVNLSISLSYMH